MPNVAVNVGNNHGLVNFRCRIPDLDTLSDNKAMRQCTVGFHCLR